MYCVMVKSIVSVFYLLRFFGYEINLGYKRLKMSNDRLENIIFIKINGPV